MRGHTLTVFVYELRRNFKRRGYLFTTFGLPILIFVLFTLIQKLATNSAASLSDPETVNEIVEEFTPDENTRIGYVDESGMFPLPDEGVANLVGYADQAAAEAALEAGEIDLFYVIAPDYMETGNVTTVLPELNISQLGNLGLVAALMQGRLAREIDPELRMRIANPGNYTEVNLSLLGGDEETGTPTEDTAFFIVYVFAVILMLTVFMTNGYLMQTVLEEKENRVIEILISSLQPLQLLTGKILALGLLGLLQIVVWIGGVYVLVSLVSGAQLGEAVSLFASLAQVELPVQLIPLLLVYYILAYLLFAGLYSIVSALFNSMREGQQYSVLFVLPAIAPLYFLSLFATSPDSGLPVFLSLFPITAPIAMTSRLVISNVPAWQIALSIGLLALTVIFVIWLAGRIFRVGILLAGQPPKLKDLPKLVRG